MTEGFAEKVAGDLSVRLQSASGDNEQCTDVGYTYTGGGPLFHGGAAVMPCRAHRTSSFYMRDWYIMDVDPKELSDVHPRC